MGFTGQPRAISFHIDRATGDRHLHVAWSRLTCGVDGRLRAIDPGLYKRKLKQLSRALEKELGLKIVSSDPAPDAKTRAAGRDEFEEARRLGIDLKHIRNTIFDCFQGAATGAAFAAALDMAGLMLAAGERCFVAIDPAGGHHALNKKLTGLTLAEIRRRFADLAELPTVAEVQRIQCARSTAEDLRSASRALMMPPDGGAHDVAAATYKCASDDFAGAAAALTEQWEASAVSKPLRQSLRALMAPQRRRQVAQRPLRVERFIEARAPP